MATAGNGRNGKDSISARVTVARVHAYKADGWCSMSAEDGDGNVLQFVGIAPCEPKAGNAYIITADREESARYGEQYRIRSMEAALPDTEAGIYEYLSAGNIKGIGKATAKKIVDAFGASALRVIHEEPERLLEIPGISRKKLAKITENAEENRMLEDIYRAAFGAVTALQAKKLFETYGKKAVEKLREDPYKALCQLDGVGFLKADKVALSCGIGEFSPLRAENAVMYVLDEVVTANGNSYAGTEAMELAALRLLDRMPQFIEDRQAGRKLISAAESWEEGREKLAKGMKLSDEQLAELDEWHGKREKCLSAIADAVYALVDRGEAIYDAERDRIASKKIHDTEQWIADAVRGMLAAENQDAGTAGAEGYMDAMEAAGSPFNGDQKAAFLRALTNRLSIITGGPGCGKTTVIALIAGYWASLGRPVYLMAPTGRASQRIRESMAEQLPGCRFHISTVHYLLANRQESDALEEMAEKGLEPIIVCDETSMADIYLAKRLLKMAGKFRTVLVGDADQLPPVGEGNFFRDLIASGKVPATWLTKNYRSTGRIIENSQKIRDGRTDLATGPDFAVIALDRDAIPERIAQEYARILRSGDATVRDICVLTPQRKRGAACVNALNSLLQERTNPPSPDRPEYPAQPFTLRLGDRVIHTKNNYSMERTAKDGTKSFGIFNGDLGIIESINPAAIGESEDGDDSWVLTVRFDDGSTARYGETDLLQLSLAYAMTVHKAQGSEFRYVIGTFTADQFLLLGRAIAYTSVTRAKKRYCAVCERRALNAAIRNVGNSKRDTFLKEMLEEA